MLNVPITSAKRRRSVTEKFKTTKKKVTLNKAMLFEYTPQEVEAEY